MSGILELAQWCVTTVLMLLAGFWLAIMLHELGHALFGKLAGLRIVACGIGYSQPILHFRIGKTHFYLARPFSGGMTIQVPKGVHSSRWANLCFVAGGPVASLLTLLAAMVAMVEFPINPFLLSLGAMSGFAVCMGVLPMQSRIAGMHLENDAALLLRYWRNKRHEGRLPGSDLDMCLSLSGFLRALNSNLGEVFYTLVAANYLISLGEEEEATNLLKSPCLSAPDRGGNCMAFEALVQYMAVASSDNAERLERLAVAKKLCADDPYALAQLELTDAFVAAERGEPIGNSVREAIDLTDDLHLRQSFEALRVIASPTDELSKDYLRLLRTNGPESLDPVIALWLAATAAQLFSRNNDADAARVLFHEAVQRLEQISASISDPEIRLRFRRRYAAPLAEAVAVSQSELPLFLSCEPVLTATHTKSAGPSGPTKLGWAYLFVLIFGLGALSGTIITLALLDGSRTQSSVDV